MAEKLTRATGAVTQKDLKGTPELIGSAAIAVGRFLKKIAVDAVTGVKTGFNLKNIGITSYNTMTTTGIVNPIPTQTKPLSTYTRGGASSYSSSSMGTSSTYGIIPVKTSPIGIKFNLPPHSWSLPVQQSLLNSNNNVTDFAGVETAVTDHKYRRAIMWCYASAGLDNSQYSWQSTGGANNTPVTKKSLDTDWGFQFLWNPDQIGNSLSRNANFTPSAVDKLAGLFGVFTAMEALSFKITINRVNDFACIKSIGTQDYAALSEFYKNGYPNADAKDLNIIKQKIIDLTNLGTMADIEYLFKMINGDGVGGTAWSNALGRKTADVGFLAPTAIAVKFGPNDGSLSYVGYVDGLTITHNMFTEDMIPIHSEVVVNFVAFARTTLVAK